MAKLISLEQLSAVANSLNNKINDVEDRLVTLDALTLNGYSIWVGTNAEYNALESKDPNTLYFEVGSPNTIVEISPSNGKLQLTSDRYQKAAISNGTEIVFPTVTDFTEIHLYFSANSDMSLVFPSNCKWRVDPNIEAGNSYELVAVYNTLEWLVNIIAYS